VHGAPIGGGGGGDEQEEDEKPPPADAAALRHDHLRCVVAGVELQVGMACPLCGGRSVGPAAPSYLFWGVDSQPRSVCCFLPRQLLLLAGTGSRHLAGAQHVPACGAAEAVVRLALEIDSRD
jgi:hypothetical protein